MNAVTEIVNTFAGLWAGQMWTIIWQSSVLAGLVVIVTLLFKRLSAAVKFWLWMLVPLRLLVMPLITISLPLLPAIAPPHIERVETAPAIIETPAVEYSPTMMENFSIPDKALNFAQIQTPPIEIQEQKAEQNEVLIKPNLLTFIMILWFAGAAFWTVRLFWSWRKIRHIVRNAIKSDQKSLIEQTSKAAAIVGLKKIPEILVTRENISPFLFGIFRPVLIIPSGFVNNVNEEGLAAVFSHEFAHLRRKDTLVGWILAICEVFYFFHPVLHFAKRRILFERERACDDWVIASGNSHKKTYANALIDAAGICRNFSAKLGPTGVVAESFGDLKKRIIAISSNIKPKTRLSKTAFVLLIFIGTICVPGFVLTNRTIAASEKATLETVREMVARNEALINPIKIEYTIKYERKGELPSLNTGGGRRGSGRLIVGSENTWAQDGKKNFVKVQYTSEPNELGGIHVYVFDDKTFTLTELPDYEYGEIRAKESSDNSYIKISEFGIGPFMGDYRLSEILIQDYATLNDKTEIINGRETYIVDACLLPYSRNYVRVWIDKQRGMPLRIWHYNNHPARSNEKSISQINDIELYQLPNGVWIPIKGTRSIDFTDSVTYEHMTVDINSITTKRDDIPESLFEIDFPDGARVHNVFTGFISIKGRQLKTYEEIVGGAGSYIAGTIVDVNGVPVPDVVVRPQEIETKQVDGSSSYRILQPEDVNCAVTDSKGRFAIELNEEGLYEIYIYPKDFVEKSVRIALGEHNQKVILEKGGTIKGRVVRYEKGQKIPVPHIEVSAENERYFTLRTGRLRTVTDSDGRFEIKYLSTNLSPRNSEDTEYRSRPWQLRCGSHTQTVVFEQGISNKEIEILLSPDIDSAAPLTGKSLPSFDGIKLDYDINQAKDKKMLVCFFDLEQRPARSGLLQLSEKVTELEKKGVKVIAIQVSNIERKTLDEWLKENNITIPVGIVEGDFEQIRFNWAIQSLPWLILTDTEHIVTDEGFSIDELDEKINKSSAVSTSGIISPSLLLSTGNNDNQSVRGVVKNKAGQAITAAKVYLYHVISNWDFGNRVEEEVTSASDGAFIFEKPLPYDDLDVYPNGRDKFVIIATHPDYALGWCNIVRDDEKLSYELVLTDPQSQTITVTDQDGNPLAGVRVWAYDMGEAEGPEPLFRENLGIVTDIGIAGAITGEDGKAIINNLPKTRCGFRTNLDGYASGLAFSGQRKIKLSKGATIRGSVLNDEGQPVENALVKFFTNWGMWQFFLTKTDSQGKFVMKDIPAQGWDMSPWGGQTTATGSYIITVEHNDYISSENQDVFMPGDVKENFIIDVYQGTLVKCNVVEKGTNKPLAGVRVQGNSESGRIDGRTDSEGVFSFRVLPGDVSLFSSSPSDGVYFLRDESSSNSTFRFEAEGDEMTVTFKTPRIAGVLTTVSGKVILPDGSPAANVGIYTTNSAAYEGGGWTGAGGAYTGTNPDGTFKLEKVPAGLKLFIYGNTKDFKYILAETINQLDDPTILSEPLVMKPGQNADVLFTDKQGNPLVNKSVKITPKMWGNDVPRAEEHHGRTDEQGHLKINGVIPGLEYFIMDARGSRSESGWWDKYFNEERILIPEDGQPVEIRTQGSAQDVMTEEISGVVEDKNGNPISMARVELLNKELAILPNTIEISGRRVRVISENAYRETSTDGSFRLKELNPGTTGIAVRADNYQTKFLEDISTGTKDLKITLDEPMSYILKGEVVDSEGNPIKGAQVTLAQDTGKITFAKVQTNDLGLFEFSDILEPIAEQNSRILIAQKEGFGLVGKMLDSTGGETYVKFVMSPEETVTGRVVDDSGNPINGAKVSLWSFNSGTYLLSGGVYFSRWTEIAPEVKTDSEGQFVFKGLPVESNVNLRAYADGYAASEGLNVKIGKAEGYAMQMGNGGMMMTSGIGVEANGEIEIVLHSGVTLKGTVTYMGTGLPVKGLKLGTQSIKESAWLDGITDESGKFEMKGVAPYPCNLLAMFDDHDHRAFPEWTAEAVVLDELEPGQVKDDIKIILIKGGVIRGKVTDAAGNPLNGIDIAFYSAARPRSGAACQLVYTSADGTWAFRFPEGEVYVYIRTNIPGAGWSRQDYTLNIKDGQEIKDIDFKLSKEVPENSPYRR